VRRLLAITLSLLFSFPLISPLFALTGDASANLPICCRRNGAHHCGVNMAMNTSGSGLKLIPRPEHCPAYPQATNAVPHLQLAVPTASLLFAEAVSHPSVKPQIQALARIARDRSRHKRGPPVSLL
jgi:hypothetical protein